MSSNVKRLALLAGLPALLAGAIVLAQDRPAGEAAGQTKVDVFNPVEGRIEMHLVAVKDQEVHIPGVGDVPFRRGESIRTEVSNKYEPARLTRLLQRAGLSFGDVTLWEINEAFASVPIAACKKFGLDEEKVNFSGSGCSLGHPIAASGARMVTTLVYELARRGGGIGVAAMCAGGGQGGAVVVEV